MTKAEITKLIINEEIINAIISEVYEKNIQDTPQKIKESVCLVKDELIKLKPLEYLNKPKEKSSYNTDQIKDPEIKEETSENDENFETFDFSHEAQKRNKTFKRF